MVKKLRKEVDRTHKESAKATLLVLEQKNELDRKKKHIQKMEQHIRKMEQHIQRLEQNDRTCIKKVVRLFQPDGEVQTKARLYDEKITQPGMEGAARVKNIVKEYAAQVEEALVGFRALAEQVISRCPPVPEPEVGETNNRGGRVPLSGERVAGDLPVVSGCTSGGRFGPVVGSRKLHPGTDFPACGGSGAGSGSRPRRSESGWLSEPGRGDGGDGCPTG